MVFSLVCICLINVQNFIYASVKPKFKRAQLASQAEPKSDYLVKQDLEEMLSSFSETFTTCRWLAQTTLLNKRIDTLSSLCKCCCLQAAESLLVCS